MASGSRHFCDDVGEAAAFPQDKYPQLGGDHLCFTGETEQVAQGSPRGVAAFPRHESSTNVERMASEGETRANEGDDSEYSAVVRKSSALLCHLRRQQSRMVHLSRKHNSLTVAQPTCTRDDEGCVTSQGARHAQLRQPEPTLVCAEALSQSSDWRSDDCEEKGAGTGGVLELSFPPSGGAFPRREQGGEADSVTPQGGASPSLHDTAALEAKKEAVFLVLGELYTLLHTFFS